MLKMYFMQTILYCFFALKRLTVFRQQLSLISNTEINGASETVRLANGPDRRHASSRATSARKNSLQERRQVEVSELPISCIFRHRE